MFLSSKYLATNTNRLAQGPDSLLRATNVVNDDGQLRPRRGQELVDPLTDKPFETISDPVANNFKPIKVFWYNNRLWAYWRNIADGYDGIGYYDPDRRMWIHSLLPSVNFNADYGMYLPQVVEADRRLLLATKEGVYASPKLESDVFIGLSKDTIQTNMLRAGVMRALPFRSHALVDLASYLNNWLQANAKVAYVHVWKKVNYNGTIVYGPPSSRLVVTNTAGASRAVRLYVTIPREIINAYASNPEEAAKYSCEIYRTYSSLPDGTGTAPDPGATFYLALEVRPTTAELAASVAEISIDDMQADLTLQDPLYTNETEDGIISERQRPPLCRVLANFNNCAWFGNTTSLWGLHFNIQAVEDGAAASKNGIRSGDVVIVGDWAFEAVTGAPTSWQFQIDTTTGYTNQINRVLNSCKSLVSQYNRNQYCSRFYLHNITGPDDFVGKLFLEEQYIGSSGDVKPFVGLYRQNGWASASDAVPISPVPLVSSDVGRGFKITQVSAPSTLGNIAFTLNAAPDFSVGDTVNVARINGDQSAWGLIPQGQYVVSYIFGNEVKLDGVLNSSGVTYTAGSGPYVGYNLLGAMHCVVDKNPGATSQAVGDRDVRPNRAYYSMPGEPESAPPLNYVDLGEADKRILAMVPLGESLFVFKEDGLFRVDGFYPNFFASLFDKNVVLLGPDLATQMNGSIYALTTKGVYRIDANGSERISFPVQNELDYITWNNPANCRLNGFAVASESDQRVMFWLPGYDKKLTAWATKPNICYVFDGLGWTKRDDQANYACTGVRGDTSNDQLRLYIAKDLAGYWITKERKSMTIFDYCDEDVDNTGTLVINSSTSCTITFGNNAAAIEYPASLDYTMVGGVLVSGGDFTKRAVITGSVGLGGGQFRLDVVMYGGLTLYDFPSLTDVKLYFPIRSDVQFGILSDRPDVRSHWSQIKLFFTDPFFTVASIGLSTDVYPGETTIIDGAKGFAEGIYSSISSWSVMRNESLVPSKTITRDIPKDHARGSQLRASFKHERALEFFSLHGIDVRATDGGRAIERNNNL